MSSNLNIQELIQNVKIKHNVRVLLSFNRLNTLRDVHAIGNGTFWTISAMITEIKCKEELDEIYVTIGCRVNNIDYWDFFFSKNCDIAYSNSRNNNNFKRIKKEYKIFRKLISDIHKLKHSTC